MIRIAICDDVAQQLNILLSVTEEYLKANNIFAEVLTFSHPDKLLNACSTQRFHLYILDIVMPMMSGIDIGIEIRRLDKETQIVFATSESSFALQSFAASPVNYLIKPIKKADFFSTLALCFSKIKDEDNITIKTKSGLITIPKYKIEFCEYVNRAVKYSLISGESFLTMSSSQNFSEQVELLLKSSNFIKPHASFIINFQHVEKLKKEEFMLNSGNIVPISKNQYIKVRDAYLDFRLRREQ